MIRRNGVLRLFAVAILLTPLARAEHTHFWKQTDFPDFQKGTANGVAIRSDGKLFPAPKFESFADPSLAYIWSLKQDSHGRLYAAGGSDAKVLRFDDSGKSTPVFESSELAAQAMAFDAKDNLYVATSPDGKVYKVTPDGHKSTFFDPKSKYIWALAIDPQGDLFVATGDTGQVFVVTPDGKGQLFYQSEERHARSLAFDLKGNLLIGTEPDGLIVRVDVRRANSGTAPAAGSAFVLFETEKSEVTSLLQEPDGNLYAASVGEKIRVQGAPRIITPGAAPQVSTSMVQGTQSIVITAQGQSATPQPATTIYPNLGATSGGAVVVKIALDGSPTSLWSSRDDIVFALGLWSGAGAGTVSSADSGGKLLLGTGDKGTINELEGNGDYSTIAQTSSAQVTDLLTGKGGKIFAATANPGKIFVLGPGYQTGGTFESTAFDARIFSHWGRLSWWGENETPKGKVEIYVRSGNTSTPGDTWSAWQGPYDSPEGNEVTCPPARFVQWKAVFTSVDAASLPAISWVNLAYQPANVAPVVDDIVVEDPGIRAADFAGQTSSAANAPVTLRSPRSPGADATSISTSDSIVRSFKVEMAPQGFQDKHYQTAVWSAHDDNDDDLTFSVYCRGEGEKNWRLLKDKITQNYYSWDTSTIPDGAYYLKIVASDAPSNPPDQALTAERESDRFVVANTPPRIENFRAESNSPSVKATFDGISSAGAIARAQYSVDSGDWETIFPIGLLSDSERESYQIQLADLSAGEHTIAVQIADAAGNLTASKTTFTVAAHASK